jgi:hypothetical protein
MPELPRNYLLLPDPETLCDAFNDGRRLAIILPQRVPNGDPLTGVDIICGQR